MEGVPIVVSLNKMPEESKQAKRSIVLAKRLQIEGSGSIGNTNSIDRQQLT